jgi:hypothetical protein
MPNLLQKSKRIPPFWLGLAVGFAFVALVYVVI